MAIGIAKICDQGLRPLRCTSADATAFESMLTDPAVGRFPKDHVHVLTDAGATTRAIKSELNWIARHAQPNDIVTYFLLEDLKQCSGKQFISKAFAKVSDRGNVDFGHGAVRQAPVMARSSGDADFSLDSNSPETPR